MSTVSTVGGAKTALGLDSELAARRDVSPVVAKLEPNVGPLTTITANTKAEKVSNITKQWFTDEFVPSFMTITADVGAGDVTITVANYPYLKAGDVLLLDNTEQLFVTATPTSSAVAVSRAYGEHAAIAASSGAPLQNMGSAFAENSETPTALSTVKVLNYNYLQFQRSSDQTTWMNDGTDSYVEKDKNYQLAQNIMLHKKHVNYTLSAGQRKLVSTAANGYLGFARGLDGFISSNVYIAPAGVLTESTLASYVRQGMRFGKSKNKTAFCSPKVMEVISGFGVEKLRFGPEEKLYGLSTAKFQSAGKVLDLIEVESFTNDSNLQLFDGLAGEMIMCEPGDMSTPYMSGMMYWVRKDVGLKTTSATLNEVCSNLTLQIGNERHYAKITGIKA